KRFALGNQRPTLVGQRFAFDRQSFPLGREGLALRLERLLLGGEFFALGRNFGLIARQAVVHLLLMSQGGLALGFKRRLSRTQLLFARFKPSQTFGQLFQPAGKIRFRRSLAGRPFALLAGEIATQALEFLRLSRQGFGLPSVVGDGIG